MSKMPGVLRPRSKLSEAELAESSERTAARLADLFGDGDAVARIRRSRARRVPIEIESSDLIGLPLEPGSGAGVNVHEETVQHDLVGVMESPTETPELVSIIVTSTPDAEMVGVMDRPATAGTVEERTEGYVAVTDVWDVPGPTAEAVVLDRAVDAAQVVPAPPRAVRPKKSAPNRKRAVAPKVATASPLKAAPKVATASPLKAAPKVAAASRSKAAPKVAAPAGRPARKAADGAAAPRSRRSRARPAAVVPSALCPSCALLMQPPPSSSRRCPRCRQSIIVRRVDGRSAYFTEAAVAVFETERQKVTDAARFTKEREAWLKLAVAAGAPAEKAGRLAAARPSRESVDAVRELYRLTVNRAFQAAKREKRWKEASRIRRDQAAVLHRLAGSPLPPPDDLLALYREGVAAGLRGLAEIVRDAELVSATCCAACQEDNGRIFPISKELAAPRLPHRGCPRVFCRCTWDLATRDRELVLRYLKRRPRAGTRPAATD